MSTPIPPALPPSVSGAVVVAQLATSHAVAVLPSVALGLVTSSRTAEFTDPLITFSLGALNIRAQEQPHPGCGSLPGEFPESIPRANRLRRDAEDPRDVAYRE